MLNYIWAGLIVFSLVFALARDAIDIKRDTFRNGKTLAVKIKVDDTAKLTGGQSAKLVIDPTTFAAFYGVSDKPTDAYPITLSANGNGAELRFAADASFPAPLSKIRDANTSDDDKQLRADITNLKVLDRRTISADVRFPPVRFATMSAIAKAAMDAAKKAVELALALIGVIALWLGLTRIGEKAGLIGALNKLVRPILRPLFPEVPKDHPAMGMIALNLTANILGMGNAATPMGLKAMEELQTLNPKKDTATNSMVMLLAMHASSVQLLPPVMVMAVMGMRVNELLVPIWIVTLIGFIAAVTSAKILERLPGYRRSDPNLAGGDVS